MAGKKRKADSESEAEDDEDFVVAVDSEDDEEDVSKEVEEESDDDFKQPKKKAKKDSPEKKDTKKKAPAKKTAKKDTKETKKKATTTKATPAKAKGGKAAATKPDVIKSESEAKRVILEYLQTSNRPYSLQNMLDNLHGRVKKAMCQKCLDKLVEEEEATCKESGKAKVYYVNQDKMEVMDPEELKALNQQIKERQQELSALTAENRTLNTKKSEAVNAPSNAKLKERIEKLTEETETKAERLKSLKEGANLCTPEQKKAAQATLGKYVTEWKKRKRWAMEVINLILDQGSKTKDELYEELDLETDEMKGVDVKDMNIM
ncbi:homologous-pairing protein [Acrasis kona]|uniref:Homologous-pairing protein 2 homolog n=1 Tax=Acrasis kona TaxID=1008807 RepID=A0AAW2ZHS1_9EUKA